MKNYSLLLHSLLFRSLLVLSLTTLSLAASAAYSSAAQAEDIPAQEVAQTSDRLALPQNAIDVPVGSSDVAWDDLSPPPVDPVDQAANQVTDQAALTEPAPATPPIALNLLQTVKADSAQKPVELSFSVSSGAIAAQVSNPEANSGANPFPDLRHLPLDQLFEGDSDSLVAKAVGSAEGTRTPEGDRNPAYYGHVDPGNKAWNLGSFSYQHSATSPEEADRKQLQRLQTQAAALQATAIAEGVDLTLEETLNGIDLANQAPKAALDRNGYIDWLAKAHAIGKTGDEAILWARSQSYLDPVTQRWNAPGLGNTEASITHDQARRMAAISEAIALYEQQVQQPVAASVAVQLQPPRSDKSRHEGEMATASVSFALDSPAS
jgi:hypothetical protein